jgi:hypothetical protein
LKNFPFLIYLFIDLRAFEAFGTKVWKLALDYHFKETFEKVSRLQQKPKAMQREVGW